MDNAASEQSRSSSGMQLAGPRLREIRQDRGLTLAAVAESAGVTKGFLSLAERGKTQVSVPNLLRICEVLDVQPGSLFDYPDHPDEPVVHGGTALEMGGEGLREFLLTPSHETHLQAMRTILEPGGGSGGAYSLQADSIFALVIRGSLELVVDRAPRHLQSGDSLTFPARSTHEWSNPGPVDAEVVWVITAPLPRQELFPARKKRGTAAG